MTKPIPSQKLSKNGLGFIGAGIGILIGWYIVFQHPDFISKKYNEDPYKTWILLLQVALAIAGIAGIITICTIVAKYFFMGSRIRQIKYRGIEINLENKKEDEDV